MNDFERLYDYQDFITTSFLGEHDGLPKDLIIQAPTGAGKTLGALFPGIVGFASKHVHQFPQKIVYGVPMRVLASSFEHTYKSYSNVFPDWKVEWNARIQTGERPEDALFEGKLIFATVDQMLASFLNIPYGISKRLDNINAGAFIGSYLVFDEFHLYPTQQMMLTVLAMLRMLKGISRFALMTATFSHPLLQKLGEVLDAQIVADEPGTPISEGIFKDIAHLQTQQRTWSVHEETLTGQHIRRALDDHYTVLCVCNMVDRAQQVYEEFMVNKPDDTECLLLHSRFYQAHRRKKEECALSWVGKNAAATSTNRKKVIIATQVVEVGLDISADVLLTECAPAASLIQRAGRCARWGAEGEVWVFQPAPDEDGNPNYAPYLDDGLKDVCIETWKALISPEFNSGAGIVMHYDLEQRLINLAHSAHDEAYLIDGLEHKIESRIEEIIRCMGNREDGLRETLIRKNSSVPLYMMADRNDERLTKSPHTLESFSLSHGQIKRLFEDIQANEDDVHADYWIAAGIENTEDQSHDDAQTSIIYRWNPLNEANQVYKNWQFVAHPDAVFYDEAYGLRAANTKGKPSGQSPVQERQNYKSYGIEPDTYVQHIDGLMQAYTTLRVNSGYPQSLRDSYRYSLMQTLKTIGRDEDWDTVDRYIRLTIALHDVGKLNKPWQNWAQKRHKLFTEYHPANTAVPADGTALAHTISRNFPSKVDEATFEAAFRQLRVPSRGNHAVESAAAATELIWQVTGGDRFWFAVITAAICHHHTPTADSVKDAFQMDDSGNSALIGAFEACGFEAEADTWAGGIQTNFRRLHPRLRNFLPTALPDRSNYHTALVYYLFVRILRLADQRSSTYVHS